MAKPLLALIGLMILLLSVGCCTCGNLTFQKDRLRDYYQSGRYNREVSEVADAAAHYIRKRVGTGTTDLALVLDIDDTALSDWAYIDGVDFGFEKKQFDAWVENADAPAIEPVLQLYKDAKHLGIKVFFITGRKEHLRSATVQNLESAGYLRFDGLFMRPEGAAPESNVAYKSSVRRRLMVQGSVIIANVGDQNSDLEGGYSEQNFKLPNPFYYQH